MYNCTSLNIRIVVYVFYMLIMFALQMRIPVTFTLVKMKGSVKWKALVLSAGAKKASLEKDAKLTTVSISVVFSVTCSISIVLNLSSYTNYINP